MAKILITGTLHSSAIEKLSSLPDAVVINRPECSRSDLESLIADAEVLVTRSETTVDSALLDKAPLLRVIARAAVGVANIDLTEATRRGILVLNTPGQNTNSAAELTMGLLLGMLRKIPEAQQHMLEGQWLRHQFTGDELRHKTIGIVGLGNVGHRVALFCRSFDMKVVGYDPYISEQRFQKYGVEAYSNLRDLCENVDVLTVHTPLNEETKGLIDKSLLKAMPEKSWVLNVARGGIIDEKALLDCLEDGHVAAAGIDTWVNEPEILQALAQHKNVYKTPHIGATTYQAQKAIAGEVVRQIEKALSGSVVDSPVNFPLSIDKENFIQKNYAVLAEKLSRFASQILDFQPSRMRLYRQGRLAGDDAQLLRLAWMKGFSANKVDGYVSYVNAEECFQRLGISFEIAEVSEIDRDCEIRGDFGVVIENAQMQKICIGGSVYDDQHLRLTDLNGFYFDIDPKGQFFIIENEDKPGVIGKIGTALGNLGVNIDSFELSRKKFGGDAMALIRVDDVAEGVQEQLGKLPYIRKVNQVSV